MSDKITEITLNWSRAYNFIELVRADKELKDKYSKPAPGVYIHTDHRTGNVSYVGKVSGRPSLWDRQFQHYKNYIGGLYLIPDIDSKSREYIWQASDKQESIDIMCDENKFMSIIHKSFEYTRKVNINLCILSTHEEAKAVERELIWALQPLDTKNGRMTPPNFTINLIHNCSEFSEITDLIANNERNNHHFIGTKNT